MPIVDAFGQRKAEEVMEDTWGHFYPEPSSKHFGEMVIAVGTYGDEVIISSEFPSLESSPMRYALEPAIFEMFEFDAGRIYRVKCGLWFLKDVWSGRIIKATCRLLPFTT